MQINLFCPSEGLNVAVDDNWDQSDDLQHLIDAYKQAQNFISQHNPTFKHHQYQMDFGLTSGFQIFITPVALINKTKYKREADSEYDFMHDELVGFANHLGMGVVNRLGQIDYLRTLNCKKKN